MAMLLQYMYNDVFQSLLNSLQSELDSLKDSSLHQRRRITDMMMSLLRDLSDIGTIVGGNSAETKVHNVGLYQTCFCFCHGHVVRSADFIIAVFHSIILPSSWCRIQARTGHMTS